MSYFECINSNSRIQGPESCFTVRSPRSEIHLFTYVQSIQQMDAHVRAVVSRDITLAELYVWLHVSVSPLHVQFCPGKWTKKWIKIRKQKITKNNKTIKEKETNCILMKHFLHILRFYIIYINIYLYNIEAFSPNQKEVGESPKVPREELQFRWWRKPDCVSDVCIFDRDEFFAPADSVWTT